MTLCKTMAGVVGAVVLMSLAWNGAADETVSKTGSAAADSEFVPVDLGSRDEVNGKVHTIAAYGVVFVLLLGYSVSITRREAKVRRELSRLKDVVSKSKAS